MRTLDTLVKEVVERFVLPRSIELSNLVRRKLFRSKTVSVITGKFSRASTFNVMDGAYFRFDLEESAVCNRPSLPIVL